jgi:hypothetical protein
MECLCLQLQPVITIITFYSREKLNFHTQITVQDSVWFIIWAAVEPGQAKRHPSASWVPQHHHGNNLKKVM